MQPTFDSQKPIFICIAEWIEDAILAGVFDEEGQVPSTTEISLQYNINPATSLKGVNMLVESGTLYKKRGLGMFVATGARTKLLERRREKFFEEYLKPLILEAVRLQINATELKNMIERGYEN
jgi:DNA-binding transcriptional regulator YhcF (GntR family)